MPPEQNVVSTPSYQLPTKPKKPVNLSWLKPLLIIIGVVLAVIIFAVLAFLYVPVVSTFASTMFFPQELKSAVFIADGQTDSTVYRLTGIGFDKDPLGSKLISASGKDAEVLYTATGTSQVIVSNKIVFATSSPVLSIAIEPSTAAAAFAVALTPQPQYAAPAGYLSSLTVDARNWRIIYHKPVSTGTLDVFGPQGIKPVFVNSHTLVYLSPAGINSWNVTTGAVKTLVAKNLHMATMSTLGSPDNTLIGFYDQTTKTVSVYRISATSAEAAGTITFTKPFTALALGNDGVYVLRRGQFGTLIEKQSFGNATAKTIGFLPKSLQITRFFTGSL